jgi:hypothetical protein
MQGFEFGTNTLDTIIPMDWEPFADANGMNTRAGKLGGIRSGRSYVISQCVMIGFLLFFTSPINNLHLVEVYTQHRRLDHHLSPTNTLLNTRRKDMEQWETANGGASLA